MFLPEMELNFRKNETQDTNLRLFVYRYFCTGSSKKMDGIVYLDLFEQYVFPQIETFEQETVRRVIFM